MVNCARPRVEYDEGRDDPIAKPDADPGLPPREPESYHRGHDHPGIEVVAVCDPTGEL